MTKSVPLQPAPVARSALGDAAELPRRCRFALPPHAVGHAPIIAILVVLVIYGPTKGRNFLVLENKSLWTEAYFMSGLYILAFVMIFTAYYGIHAHAYGAP